MNNDILTFGKIRASWARVGKDANPYVTSTYLWPVGTYIGGVSGVGHHWQRGNANLKPEITESTELGLELRFFKNRLKFDYAYYTNNRKLTRRISYYLFTDDDLRNEQLIERVADTPTYLRTRKEWEAICRLSNTNETSNK